MFNYVEGGQGLDVKAGHDTFWRDIKQLKNNQIDLGDVLKADPKKL